jgi:hypothetical protein
VANGGGTVFTTGGLVSGAGRTTFALRASPIVFVTVTAPRSGTAWESCSAARSDAAAPCGSRARRAPHARRRLSARGRLTAAGAAPRNHR